MTTLTLPRPAKRRYLRFVIAALVFILIIALLIPSTRRYLANPTAATPIETQQVAVLADPWQNHRYAPAVVRVPVGTTITWAFVDRGNDGIGEPAEHNVVGDAWASPVLAEGTWQHTFTEPGRYRYTCTLHPGMDGIVEVVPAS
jgi:plastocyanin